MHCKACDKLLGENELTFNDELGDWELCTTCLQIAYEAAYGKNYDQDQDRNEGEIPLLDMEFDEDDPRERTTAFSQRSFAFMSDDAARSDDDYD